MHNLQAMWTSGPDKVRSYDALRPHNPLPMHAYWHIVRRAKEIAVFDTVLVPNTCGRTKCLGRDGYTSPHRLFLPLALHKNVPTPKDLDLDLISNGAIEILTPTGSKAPSNKGIIVCDYDGSANLEHAAHIANIGISKSFNLNHQRHLDDQLDALVCESAPSLPRTLLGTRFIAALCDGDEWITRLSTITGKTPLFHKPINEEMYKSVVNAYKMH